MEKAIVRLARAVRMVRGTLVIAVAGACGGGAAELARAPGAPLAMRARAEGGETKGLVLEAPTPNVVLADPRFAAVNERVRARDAAGASRAFVEARAQVTPVPEASRACAFDYVEGRLAREAGDDAGAALAFDRVTPDCALAAHAALYAGGAYARLGRPDDAIARAQRVPEDTTVAAEARLVEGEVRAARGEKDAALAIWRAHLAASPHGVRWVDTAVKVAQALGDGAARREAYDLVTRVVVEAPKLAEVSSAQAVRDRLTALIRVEDPRFDDALTLAEHARRAQAWLDGNEPAKAVAEVEPLLAIGSASPPVSGDACRAALVRGQALAKKKGAPAADAFGDAITRCAGDDALVTALFAGGKASLSARREAEGLDRFARVEALFPKHRFADDARFKAALAVQSGDTARAEAMLASLPVAYPEGDMRGEALFRLALARMARGEWESAKGALDDVVAIDPDDRRGASAGRAAYFRARASAMTGDASDAAARYEAMIARAPLSFYMAQAYARLAATDPDRARRAIEDAVARESQAPRPGLVTRDHAELRSPAFARGLALLEVGEIDDARRELARVATDGADPEVLWTVARVYERAGAPDIAAGLVHARLTEHLGHWPVAGWRACWEVAFPRPFGDLVEQASAASGIPPVLTWAIMREESSFDPGARSPSDAYGLMQIILPTARGLVKGTPFGADPESLKRPEVSITLGAKLLGGLRASYPANKALAIAAYNGGGGAVGRWLAARPQEDFDLWVEEIPFDETRGYVKRVLGNQAAYAFLYSPEGMNEVLALPSKVTK